MAGLGTGMSLQWMENDLLFLIREIDAVNFANYTSAPPVFNAMFTKALIDGYLNSGIVEFLSKSQWSPRMTEKILTVPTSAIIDFALPADCASLRRVEYQQNANTQIMTALVLPITTAGTQAATPQEMTGIVAGIALQIDSGSAQETVLVASVTPTTFTATFGQVHAENAAVAGPYVNATLTSPVSLPGLQSVNISSVTGIVVGTVLTIDYGLPTQENVVVTNVGVGNITTTFLYTHLSSAAVAGYAMSTLLTPYPLDSLSIREFDQERGTAQYTTLPTGLPWCYREPVANCIRFWYAIGPTQVSNGDNIVFTYQSYGSILTAPTDIPGFPAEFHRAAVYHAASRLWMVKQESTFIESYLKMFTEKVSEAKASRFTKNQDTNYAFTDLEGGDHFDSDRYSSD